MSDGADGQARRGATAVRLKGLDALKGDVVKIAVRAGVFPATRDPAVSFVSCCVARITAAGQRNEYCAASQCLLDRLTPDLTTVAQVQESMLDMAAQNRLSAMSALPDHFSSNGLTTELSLDELRFLRSCSRRPFELSPAEASAIIQAARNLNVDLVHEASVYISTQNRIGRSVLLQRRILSGAGRLDIV